MTDSRVPLKNPYLAVFLGLLIPGGGHLYQGRTFKGVLYAVCIVSTFVYGMFLSDWTALYAGSPLSSSSRRWGFLAQTPIGMPAVYALAQKSRYGSQSNVPQMGLQEPISAPFQGAVQFGSDQEITDNPALEKAIAEAVKAVEDAVAEQEPEEKRAESDEEDDVKRFAVEGRIELRPTSAFHGGPAVEGRLTGHLLKWNPDTGNFDNPSEPIELKLSSVVGRFELAREIYADPNRELRIDVVDDEGKKWPRKIGVLRGTIPRPVTDWFAVPLEQEKLSRLHARFGKTYDLALVYTWIASLLNVLVLWDAFEGPAYGYGDEKPDEDSDPPQDGKSEAKSKKSKSAPESKTAAATTT